MLVDLAAMEHISLAVVMSARPNVRENISEKRRGMGFRSRISLVESPIVEGKRALLPQPPNNIEKPINRHDASKGNNTHTYTAVAHLH